MMAGELMAHGYDAINIPYARKLEFNQCLDELFTTDNATPLLNFLTSCLADQRLAFHRNCYAAQTPETPHQEALKPEPH